MSAHNPRTQLTDERERVLVGTHRWSVRRWGMGSTQAQLTTFAVHGFAGTGDDFAPLLGDQAIAGPWMTCDVLGHGNSDAPGPEQPRAYEMPAVAAELSQLITKLVTPPYILVGYSMGGRLALSMLLDDLAWPRPAGVVLIGATPGIADPELREQRRLDDHRLASNILDQGIDWFAEYWATRPVLAGKHRIAPEHRRAMEHRLREQRPVGLAGSLRGMGTGAMPPLWEALDRFDTLEIPLLLVTGAEDRKFTAIAQDVCAAVSRAETVALEGVGHTAHLEAPGAFASALKRWRGHSLGRV